MEAAKLKEIDHFKHILSVSGYTKAVWDIASCPKLPPPPRDPNTIKKKGHVTLPYFGPTSDAIARVIRRAGVAVHMKPANTIRSQLVHPKDKVSRLQKPGTVYHITCRDCPASYVGETERVLGKRVEDHTKSTSFAAHCREADHCTLEDGLITINDDQVAVRHTELDWFKRGVAEAIHIDLEKPTLNRDKGRHTLPVIYRELLARDRSGHGAQAHQHSNGKTNQFTRRSDPEGSENS